MLLQNNINVMPYLLVSVQSLQDQCNIVQGGVGLFVVERFVILTPSFLVAAVRS